MKTWRMAMMIGFAVTVIGCGGTGPSASTENEAARILNEEDEALLDRLETETVAYQPVTKANYESELAGMEAELATNR